MNNEVKPYEIVYKYFNSDFLKILGINPNRPHTYSYVLNVLLDNPDCHKCYGTFVIKNELSKILFDCNEKRTTKIGLMRLIKKLVTNVHNNNIPIVKTIKNTNALNYPIIDISNITEITI